MVNPPPLPPPAVSVIGPVDQAIGRVKTLLFRPFNFEKWLTIGFCAWLASLGGGGYRFNYNGSSNSKNPEMGAMLGRAADYAAHNLNWIIPVAVLLVLLIVALCVVFLWLGSRGQFMLLHCIALDRGEVVVPWKKYAREAWSLWLFRLVLLAAASALFLFMALLIWGLLTGLSLHYHPSAWSPAQIVATVIIGGLFFCSFLAIRLIGHFTTQFVVPIMYLRSGTCLEAWRVFLDLLGANKGRFVLYLLFQIVLLIAIIAAIAVVFICTCCIACCFVVIPFVGSVVLLPITAFYRSYTLYYLAQYGAGFDAFRRLAD